MQGARQYAQHSAGQSRQCMPPWRSALGVVPTLSLLPADSLNPPAHWLLMRLPACLSAGPSGGLHPPLLAHPDAGCGRAPHGAAGGRRRRRGQQALGPAGCAVLLPICQPSCHGGSTHCCTKASRGVCFARRKSEDCTSMANSQLLVHHPAGNAVTVPVAKWLGERLANPYQVCALCALHPCMHCWAMLSSEGRLKHAALLRIA